MELDNFFKSQGMVDDEKRQQVLDIILSNFDENRDGKLTYKEISQNFVQTRE